MKDFCLLHSGPNISGRKRKHEDDERHTIPNVLQGEVARLDVKFVVNLDPTFCSNNGTVHLVCKLGESRPASIQPHPHILPGSRRPSSTLRMVTTAMSWRFLCLA